MAGLFGMIPYKCRPVCCDAENKEATILRSSGYTRGYDSRQLASAEHDLMNLRL